MATVAAVVYEHHKKNDGTFNVKIRVYHKSQKKYIDTTHFVSRRQLDAEFNIKDKYLIRVLEETLEEYRDAITQLKAKVDFLTCEALRDYLQNLNSDIDFIKFAQQHIDRLVEEGREPYSKCFRVVRNSLIDYFKRTSASITEITSMMLYNYERFLKKERTHKRINQLGKEVITTEKGLSESGLHNHMRDLRTLFNAARNLYNDDDLGIYKIKHYPFKKYKIGSAPLTESRDNTIVEVKIIMECKTEPGSRAELAKDLYMLSFYMCGMNAVDLYNSQTKWIKNGRLEYNRAKTKGRRKDRAFISIKIIDEALPLLNKYIGRLASRYCNYEGLDTALSDGFKKLRELTGIPDITLYWARHTFATLARNECRMSKDDVGQALNHIDNGHRTTDIYIAKDWRIVDEVQENVLNLLRPPMSSAAISKVAPHERRSAMRVVHA